MGGGASPVSRHPRTTEALVRDLEEMRRRLRQQIAMVRDSTVATIVLDLVDIVEALVRGEGQPPSIPR
jgi:molecular chaperone GrpE (heat shock protein)